MAGGLTDIIARLEEQKSVPVRCYTRVRWGVQNGILE